MKILLFLSLILLLILISFFNLKADRYSNKFSGQIGELPLNLEWEMKEKDLGEGRIKAEVIENILRFDDYRFWEISDGQDIFSLYIAYWKPRSESFLETSTHAPDNCFVSSGMRLLEKNKLVLDSGLKIESRVFDSSGTRVYATYLHVFGDEIIDYSSYSDGKTLSFVTDNLPVILSQAGHQYFIRVTSIRPLVVGNRFTNPNVENFLNELYQQVQTPTKSI